MSRSPALRTIATAMLIMGFLTALLGAGFMVLGREGSAAMAVVVTGLLQVMLGVVFMSQSRR